MTEKGSDELLYDVTDAEIRFEHQAEVAQAEIDAEEQRVLASEPATNEPGGAYPDPDTTPEGDPPDYDPTPPEAP